MDVDSSRWSREKQPDFDLGYILVEYASARWTGYFLATSAMLLLVAYLIDTVAGSATNPTDVVHVVAGMIAALALLMAVAAGFLLLSFAVALYNTRL